MKKLQYSALTILDLGLLLTSCGDGSPPFGRVGPWGDPPSQDPDDGSWEAWNTWDFACPEGR